jgi:hypothetical protein
VARAATPGYSHRDVRDHESSGQFEHALRPLTEPTVSCVGKGQARGDLVWAVRVWDGRSGGWRGW